MSRLMSVAFTEQAVVERRKTVTRRKGWTFLKPGDTLTLCRKVQGRRRSDGTVEPIVRLAEVEVLDVRRERLSPVDADGELAAEGCPDMSATEFIGRYFEPQGIHALDLVTRIEWRYLT